MTSDAKKILALMVMWVFIAMYSAFFTYGVLITEGFILIVIGFVLAVAWSIRILVKEGFLK